MKEKKKIPHNMKNMIGRKISYLTVVERVENYSYVCKTDGRTRYKAQWLCLCVCGNTTIRTTGYLGIKKISSTSCGCKKSEDIIKMNKLKRKKYGESACNSLLARYKHDGLKRGYTWELTYTTFKEITSSVCHYCGTPPYQVQTGQWSEYVYNGIDRIDSNKGYIPENVLPCCGCCNLMKLDMSYNDFIAVCTKIVMKSQGNKDYKLIKDNRKSAYERRFGKPRIGTDENKGERK